MAELLTNLIGNGDALKSIFRSRSKPYYVKTVSGKTALLAQQKAELEVKEGWEIIPSQLKKSVRLRMLKPFDIRLEDEIWSMLVKMGFEEFSKDRNFKIFVDDKTPPRQIDVFTKDSETALLVECTSSEEKKEKSVNDLIEKILSISSPVFQSINKHYGPDVKLKLRWVIATRNVQWRPVDLAKAEANKIMVLRDEEIDYFKKLADLFKTAAKYQLLAHIFSDEKIHEIDIRVPATKGRMGKQTFYNFLIRPFDLLKIAYISHKRSRSIKDIETYQRMLIPKRLKSIAKYIDNGGQFPTNIVINIKTKQELVFEKKDVIGESSFGTLHLPNRYASAWIIDGQHRLYGYVFSKRMLKHSSDKTTFPVLAYESLPPLAEADLFVDINSKQERVKQNLIKEIYADLKWESKDFKEKLDALRSKTAIRLNAISDSPLCDRFALASKSRSNYTCLTLASFADGLKENRFFGEQAAVFKPGPLYASYEEDLDVTLEKACTVLTYYFDLFKKALPEHWSLGDAPGGYLCTNNAVRSLLIILREILADIKNVLKIDLDDLDAESIIGHIDKYVEPLINFFSDANLETIRHLRSRQAIKGVNDNAIELMARIHDQHKEFCPDRLKEYLETIDIAGTGEAKNLMGEIQITMFRFVTDKLKETFGDENWWYEGIPEKVRLSCSEIHQKEKGVKKVEQYIHLLDYQTIAAANWSLFEKTFAMTKDGGKEKKLKWIADLNTVRNITHHEEKWPATKDQVNFVRQVHKFVKQHFV